MALPFIRCCCLRILGTVPTFFIIVMLLLVHGRTGKHHYHCATKAFSSFTYTRRNYYKDNPSPASPSPLSSSSLKSTTTKITTAAKFYNSSKIDSKAGISQDQNQEQENMTKRHSFKEEDIILNCTDGIQLAAKRWSSIPLSQPTCTGANTSSTYKNRNAENSSSNSASKVTNRRKILCLHGWLDNAASFHIVAPEIIKQLGGSLDDSMMNHIDVVAIDLPGHGFSAHKSPDGPPQLLSEYALYAAEALHSLNWIDENNGSNETSERSAGGVTLIGHSMGAGVALVFAAAYPEHVNNLILLEGSGPLARKSVDAGRQVRDAIKRRIASNRKLYPELSEGGCEINVDEIKSQGHRGKKKYVSLEAAISARMKTASLSPGEQRISREAATALVGRAVVQAGDIFNPSKAGGKEIHPSTFNPSKAVYFRHDSRLMWPSFQYFTEEQVRALLSDTQCPSCLIVAEDGWPTTHENERMVREILQPTVFQRLPGSHHFHADPEDASEVCKTIVSFLK